MQQLGAFLLLVVHSNEVVPYRTDDYLREEKLSKTVDALCEYVRRTCATYFVKCALDGGSRASRISPSMSRSRSRHSHSLSGASVAPAGIPGVYGGSLPEKGLPDSGASTSQTKLKNTEKTTPRENAAQKATLRENARENTAQKATPRESVAQTSTSSSAPTSTQPLAQVSIHYMFEKPGVRLQSNTKKRYEQQIHTHLTGVLQLLTARTVPVLACDLSAEVVKGVSAWLEVSPDEALFKQSVGDVLTKHARHRNYLQGLLDEVRLLRYEKQLRVLVLYSLKDDVFRLILAP